MRHKVTILCSCLYLFLWRMRNKHECKMHVSLLIGITYIYCWSVCFVIFFDLPGER